MHLCVSELIWLFSSFQIVLINNHNVNPIGINADFLKNNI